MHNKKIHIKFGSKIHKVLFDNTMGAGVETSAIAQNNYGIGVKILCPKVLIPYTFYIVADKFGGVVTRAYRHVSHLLKHLSDKIFGHIASPLAISRIIIGTLKEIQMTSSS